MVEGFRENRRSWALEVGWWSEGFRRKIENGNGNIFL